MPNPDALPDCWSVAEGERHDGKPQLVAVKRDADGNPVRDPESGRPIAVTVWGRVGSDPAPRADVLLRDVLLEEARLAGEETPVAIRARLTTVRVVDGREVADEPTPDRVRAELAKAGPLSRRVAEHLGEMDYRRDLRRAEAERRSRLAQMAEG